MSDPAHSLGCPVALWLMDSYLTPFFWLVNKILTIVAAVKVWGVSLVSVFV